MNFPLAIFLDLDDTILAFTEVADDCWKSLCLRYADALPGVTGEALYAAVTRSREWFWSDAERHRIGRNDLQLARRQIVRQAFENHGIHKPDIAWQLADAYTSEREKLVRPFPGAIATLQELHRRGVQLALLTNGEAGFQRAKIGRFGIEPYFHCIVVEGEFGVGKPDKSVFEYALTVLKRTPQEVWMVGDNLAHDIAPALDLGMQGIWVDYARVGLPKTAPCVPSRIICALTELMSEE
jgi:putative hydrolase of the HAD superfamily